MDNLDEEICSAKDCHFAINLQHGCVDYIGRRYCCPDCAYVALEREGVDEVIEKVDSLKKLGKKVDNSVDYLSL